MPKAFCIAGAAVAILLLIVFVADLTIPQAFKPFGGASLTMDIGMSICAAILGYLSWSTYRQLDS